MALGNQDQQKKSLLGKIFSVKDGTGRKGRKASLDSCSECQEILSFFLSFYERGEGNKESQFSFSG
uniref:Uncharacterized protein n=1 Tax=Rhizophora mucronata TaxID=61149 RepID=A0A2P2LSI0_RHIMU